MRDLLISLSVINFIIALYEELKGNLVGRKQDANHVGLKIKLARKI